MLGPFYLSRKRHCHSGVCSPSAAFGLGADAGIPVCNTFGRNEPALHHYHNTYWEALGMELLES